MSRASLALLLVVAACGVHTRTERRWAGPLTATKPQCPPMKGILLLRDGIVTFAPDEGTWVLNGAATAQTLTATQARPTSDHKLYKTELVATWTDQSVQGTYTTPDCAYHLDLTRY